MSARSRYLEAISPRSNDTNDNDDVLSPSGSRQNYPPNNNYSANNNANNAGYGTKRVTTSSSSIKSPSSMQRNTLDNNNSGAVHAFISKSGHHNASNNNAIVSQNSPPPPPPPGMPVKRSKKYSSGNNNINNNNSGRLANNHYLSGQEPSSQLTAATNNNNNIKSSAKEQLSNSPVRAAGEQWSPREEIQSGNVQKYKNMIWGGGSAREAGSANVSVPSSSTTAGGVGNVVNASVTNRNSSSNSGAPPPPPPVNTRPMGKSPARTTTTTTTTTSSPSRPTPFYKRTAPSPIITTPNRPTSNPGKTTSNSTTSASSNNNIMSVPTPPSRVGVRLQSSRGSSPSLTTGGSSGVGMGKPATPLQQRGGSLNISPLVTNFEGESHHHRSGSGHYSQQQVSQSYGQGGGVVVRSNLYQSSTTSNNTTSTNIPSSPPPQQQDGVTTLTAFKRPNHKVGIIFTRQSSSSPDIAVIARVLPESIFGSHDQSARREQMTSGRKVKGLEGSEVIAVNGVPVRNPRHAAEMVAKAVEEIRLSIRRVDGGNKNGGSSNNKVGGEKGMYGGVLKKTSPVFTPKVPELNGGESPQDRQEQEEGRNVANSTSTGVGRGQYHQLPNLARPRSIDEESSFSVRTESPEQQQRKGMSSLADEMSAVTETEELSMPKKEPIFGGKRATPTQQSVREKDSAAAAAEKSKEIADMRRKVAQAMLMSQEMVHDPVSDIDHDIIDSEDDDEDDDDDDEEDEWTAPQPITKSPLMTQKKAVAPSPSPKSPSMDLADRRRQAALDMYYSQEMVGDNIDDVALGTAEVVGLNKQTIAGGGLPPPMPMKDMERVNSFGTSSVASKARTDVTTESMATQQMGSTSPKVMATSQSGEEEEFQFEDEGKIETKAVVMTTNPAKVVKKVEREPEEVVAAVSTVTAGAVQELQRQRAVTREESKPTSKTVVVAPPSPAREVVAESPGRKGLFGKKKSQKKSKMFGGMKNMLKPNKFKKNKADKGIPLVDSKSNSNEENIVDSVEPQPSRPVVAAAPQPKATTAPSPPPVTESQVTEPTEDLFAPPDQSNSWGDDFFKDPFANSPFNDPAQGDPYGFPETERARNGDAFGFDHTDAWGEPQTLPDVKSLDSPGNLSNAEMSEITNPSFISRKTDKKETIYEEEVADSKENYSVQSKTDFIGGHAEVMRSNFAREHADAMRSRMLNKTPSETSDPPLDEMETFPSNEGEEKEDDKIVSNLMAKSRIISKYGKNRRTGRGSDPVEMSPPRNTRTPPRQNTSRTPVAHSPGQAIVQHEPVNELALAREQAIEKQRAIDIAAAKSKQMGSSSPYASKNYRKPPSSSMTQSPVKYSNNPIQKKKKVASTALYRPAQYSVEDYLLKVKDPVQRAGVRLLWAAAIPVQAQIRSFLARQHAIRKMCAVLTIQSFVRRWNAERNLEIAVWSAIQIQAAFRGWFARDSLEDNHYCATQIQRITRGYLATIRVFEDLYSITIVQSVVRRFLAINVAVDRLSSIIAIQAWYRGIRAREQADERYYSAIAIQSTWRRYMCQMTYQFDIIDIIIVQSIVRRRQAIQLRKKTAAVVRIQALARAIVARKEYAKAKALHDQVTRHTSATIIQSCWRSYSAQVKMLMTIVNIIVIQSIWRRRAVEKIYKPHLHRIKLAKERKRYNAATKIQSAWRGFTDFSAYTIIRYENHAATIIQSQWRGYLHSTNYCIMLIEIVRIQALVRGRQERSWLKFQNECASIIQAAMRGYLTRKELHNESMISVLISAAATSLRTRNAARTLQRWWVEEMWRQKQKKSALIIERFFIYVKKEVEKEIKAMKKKKRQRKKMKKYMQSDDWLLENAWQGLEAAGSVDNSIALQAAAAPAVSTAPYNPGMQQQYQPQYQQQQMVNQNVHTGMSPSRIGGGIALPPSGGTPNMMSGQPAAVTNYSAQAAANHSIPRNNSLRQQHGYRGRRYDRTDDDSLALDAAFDEASAHDSRVGSSNQYRQRSSSRGYRGRRYN